jgi:hypothetical protein
VTTEKLIRLAGLAAVLGSVWLALFPFLHPNHDPAGYRSALWIPAHLSPHIAAITYLFALPALYARQGARNGWLGLAGYVMATLGTAQLLMLAWVELFMFPWLGLQGFDLDGPPPPGVDVAAPLMQLSLGLGYMLVGLGIVRAGVLPRSAGVLLAIAAPFFSFGDLVLHLVAPDTTIDLFMATTGLLALAMGYVGLSLWRGRPARRAAKPAALEPVPDATSLVAPATP